MRDIDNLPSNQTEILSAFHFPLLIVDCSFVIAGGRELQAMTNEQSTINNGKCPDDYAQNFSPPA
jgi:hypothetical protein